MRRCICRQCNNFDGYSIRYAASLLSKRPESRKRTSSSEPRESRRGGGHRNSRGSSEAGESNPHEAVLRQQAIDAAKEVRRWGEPVTLPEMNAHDRRIVHITLEKEADLTTESTGEGSRKSVVIALKK